MQDNEDCVVCFGAFTRNDRIPRLLHCKHTFCAPCLEQMSRMEGAIRTITCPLCRWITCTSSSLTLPSVLWINTEIWDCIAEQQQQKQQQEQQQKKKRLGSLEEDLDLIPAKQQLPTLKSKVQKMFGLIPKNKAKLGRC